MSLNLNDVYRIANLARLEISESQAQETAHQLNDILQMIEQISRVDTSGVLPMAHPLDGIQRLRPDAVTEHPDREATMANAPAREDGLFLVPRVVE
jgi:aspartyl-tRNA(Asn)/glutamyl-tRNA(Gln) amidotransferase subunit C